MGLDFDKLREENVARCEECFHSVDGWSAVEWTNALAGEVGELCNFTKKMLRGDFEGKESEGIGECSKELGDIIAYADLVAARLGINLGKAVAEKFNTVSKRIGSPRRL